MATKNKLIKDVYYNMNKSKCESAEFIRAVRNNPALYDPDNSDYKMATVKDAIWKELANQFGVTCDVAKKRWKSLRDTYTKKYRISEDHASNFKYGKELHFLKSYMKAERSQNITIPKTTLNSNARTEFEFKTENENQEYQFQEVTPNLNETDFLQELDIQIFISQIKEHQCIWNQNFDSYSTISEKRNKSWFVIGKTLIEDFEELDQENQNHIIKILKRKWRRLREKYFTTKKTIETRPGSNPHKIFTYYSNLSFIDNGLRDLVHDEFKETDSNFGLNMKAEYLSDTQLNDNFCDENTIELIQDDQNTITQKIPSDIEEDEDRLFLLSLVKEMKKIPKDHKLDARLNILVVLRNWQKMHYTDSNLDKF